VPNPDPFKSSPPIRLSFRPTKVILRSSPETIPATSTAMTTLLMPFVPKSRSSWPSGK
jgi:hypothetical protein